MFTTSALVLMSVAATAVQPQARTTPAAVQHPRRISGTTAFAMPDTLAAVMNRDGESEVDYRGRVCVGSDGVPTSVRAVERTGIRQADRKVEKTVMGWRYAPYRVSGVAVPFCTAVRYRFELPTAGMADPVPRG